MRVYGNLVCIGGKCRVLASFWCFLCDNAIDSWIQIFTYNISGVISVLFLGGHDFGNFQKVFLARNVPQVIFYRLELL